MVRKSGMKNIRKKIFDSSQGKFGLMENLVYRDFEPATSTNYAEGFYFMEDAQIISGFEGALLRNSLLLLLCHGNFNIVFKL